MKEVIVPLKMYGNVPNNEMITHARAWRPWRAVAARLLWSYYAALKNNLTSDPV